MKKNFILPFCHEDRSMKISITNFVKNVHDGGWPAVVVARLLLLLLGAQSCSVI